jgi:N-acetylglucosaminyl-diphospho-decaprenol L-rhamnosyltransferase
LRTSVLTIVRGRAGHLRNLILGLQQQTRYPDELVIAWMQPEPVADLPDLGCPIRHLHVPGDRLPLAASRNAAAAAARNELLVFLDVDCIPSPNLVASYAEAAEQRPGLFLGEVFYLPTGAAHQGWTFGDLDRLGTVHPSKPPIPLTGVREEPNAGELWGLSFALSKEAYLSIGGMDEGFVGYGGEETDFASRFSATGLPVYWTANARAYHQHHPIAVPPLQHFDDIVANATRFHRKHGRWCMDYWLGQLASFGLIAWTKEAQSVRVLKRPDPADLERSKRAGDGMLFS